MITNKEKNFISAVLYVHNSESQLNGFLPKLYTALSDKFEKFEIICVNDGSTDDSKKVIAQISKDMILAAVSVIHMSAYQGIEASMNAGMDLAIGDFVYEFDTLSVDYDISLIGRIYDKALEGFDIVSAAPPLSVVVQNCFIKYLTRIVYLKEILFNMKVSESYPEGRLTELNHKIKH